MSEKCAACGASAQGNASIHRDGFCDGPEVPLCDGCGMEEGPTCPELWEAIKARLGAMAERDHSDTVPMPEPKESADEQ